MKKIAFTVVALMLLGAGSLFGYRFAHQHALWELRDELGLVSEEDGRIAVYTEGEIEKKSLEDIKKAAAYFNEYTKKNMDASLHRPVQLFVSGEEESYKTVLEREFGLSGDEAARVAAISGGWSGGSIHITAVNASAGVMTTFGDRYNTTGHELFHQLQHELSHGKDVDERSLFWLEEGSADYIGSAIADSLGGKPLWKWQLDVKAALLRARSTVKPTALQHCDFEQRKKLMDKSFHTYQVADLMTGYLLEKFPPEKRLVLIGEYFRALSKYENGEDAFHHVFGMDLENFLQEYMSWWNDFCHHPAVFHYETGPGLKNDRAIAIENEIEAMQHWLEGTLGTRLRGEYFVFLSGNEGEMAKALAKYTELNIDKARSMAASSLCVENGGVLIVNGAHLEEDKQRAFSLGILAMRTYEGQVLGEAKDKGHAWLLHGAAYMAGINRQAAVSGYMVKDYIRTAQEIVRGRNLPRAETLQNESDYKKAVERYGEKEIAAVTELAVYELIRNHGWSSFVTYLQETAKNNDGGRAYRNIYGK